MPYIPKDRREKYNNLINDLAHILNNLTSNDELSGEMNYVLFRLARLLANQEAGGQRRYARIAVIKSALIEARDEFWRREMIPYEKEKIELNGDVEL
jgi:hypothetical protein